MSDKIYIGDEIPDGYIYGNITDTYIELFNKPTFQNETVKCYRIYYRYSDNLVVETERTFSNYNSTTYPEVPVSRDVFDRPHFANIVVIVFCLSLFGVWLLNLVTSIIKRGGLLGGLF